jgi:hypothetical protein
VNATGGNGGRQARAPRREGRPRTASFEAADVKGRKDVKVGDEVEVTHTEAFIISVK